MKKDFVVSAFVFSKQESTYKLLLLYHRKLNRWLIPGGHIEYGENPVEAIYRELYEETNLKKIHLFSFIHKENIDYSDAKFIFPPEYVFEEKVNAYNSEAEHIHIDLIYFAISESNEEIKYNKKESNGIIWCSEDELDKLNLFEMTYTIAKKAFKNLHMKEL